MSRGNRGDGEREKEGRRKGGLAANRHSVSADGYLPVYS